MTHPAISRMLEPYDLSTTSSSYDALREILQEIILLALYDAGFFKQAAFYGGTALRILHGLPRFSEDLDFSLLEPQPGFDISPFQQAIVETLQAYGFVVSMEVKNKSTATAVASAFIKGNTLEHLLAIQAPAAITQRIHHGQTVKSSWKWIQTRQRAFRQKRSSGWYHGHTASKPLRCRACLPARCTLCCAVHGEIDPRGGTGTIWFGMLATARLSTRATCRQDWSRAASFWKTITSPCQHSCLVKLLLTCWNSASKAWI